jgi:formate dehydrogenase maturation protein FdhE
MKKEVDTGKKLLKNTADALKSLAESVKDNSLGKHVANVIEAHGGVSIALLKEAIETSINQSSSINDESKHPLDSRRLNDEAVLNYLNNLLAKHREHSPDQPMQ